jgi:hypothetical protein
MTKLQSMAIWAIKNGYSVEYEARNQRCWIGRPDGAARAQIDALGLPHRPYPRFGRDSLIIDVSEPWRDTRPYRDLNIAL